MAASARTHASGVEYLFSASLWTFSPRRLLSFYHRLPANTGSVFLSVSNAVSAFSTNLYRWNNYLTRGI